MGTVVAVLAQGAAQAQTGHFLSPGAAQSHSFSSFLEPYRQAEGDDGARAL